MSGDPLARLVSTAEHDLNTALDRHRVVAEAQDQLHATQRELSMALDDARLYRALYALAPFTPSYRLRAQIPAQRRPEPAERQRAQRRKGAC